MFVREEEEDEDEEEKREAALKTQEAGRLSTCVCVSLCLTPRAEILHHQPLLLHLHTVHTEGGGPGDSVLLFDRCGVHTDAAAACQGPRRAGKTKLSMMSPSYLSF